MSARHFISTKCEKPLCLLGFQRLAIGSRRVECWLKSTRFEALCLQMFAKSNKFVRSVLQRTPF